MTDTAITPHRRDDRGRFLTGNNGGGRPKGSRNRLGEKFIEDAFAEWQKSGPQALKTMAKNDPSGFCKLIGYLLPKEIDATLTLNSEMFAEITDYVAAFRLARQVIGSDDAPMIELNAEPIHD